MVDKRSSRKDLVKPKGLDWLVEPLNGGFRAGGQYLLAGPPSSLKTTLAVQVACGYALRGLAVLIALTEQSVEEVRGIFRRICGGRHFETVMSRITLVSLTNLDELPLLILQEKRKSQPSLVIVDSVQGHGLPSTATRTYRKLSQFQSTAKRLEVTTLCIAQLTKSGDIAGPKTFEYQVDACLSLRKAGALRQLFIPKHRYGPEVVEPVTLSVREYGLAPFPHSRCETAVVLAYCGWGQQPLEVQVSTALPRIGGRAELNAPFLPARRIRQLINTVNGLPGVDLQTVSYMINALIPGGEGYNPAMELPLAVALLSAYLRQPPPPRALFVGGVDLLRRIRAVQSDVVAGLVEMLAREDAPVIERVYLASGSATLFEEIRSTDREGSSDPQVIAVPTLDALAQSLWPEVFRGESDPPSRRNPKEVPGR